MVVFVLKLTSLIILVVGTELEASRLSVEQLEPLKEELNSLYNSVSVKISNLLKESEVLAEWTEGKRTERAQVNEVIFKCIVGVVTLPSD